MRREEKRPRGRPTADCTETKVGLGGQEQTTGAPPPFSAGAPSVPHTPAGLHYSKMNKEGTKGPPLLREETPGPPGERLLHPPDTSRGWVLYWGQSQPRLCQKEERRSQDAQRPGAPWMGRQVGKMHWALRHQWAGKEGDTRQRPLAVTALLGTQGTAGRALRNTQKNVQGTKKSEVIYGKAPERELLVLFLQLFPKYKITRNKVKAFFSKINRQVSV